MDNDELKEAARRVVACHLAEMNAKLSGKFFAALQALAAMVPTDACATCGGAVSYIDAAPVGESGDVTRCFTCEPSS
jgi:hypothetical protein